MKRIILLLIVFLSYFHLRSNAQSAFSSDSWLNLWRSGANFYDVQNSFNQYWIDKLGPDYIQEEIKEKHQFHLFGHEEEEKPGYEQFKRWEYYMEPRVFPSGDVTLPSTNWEKYQQWLGENLNNRSLNGNWTVIGPQVVPTNGGAGRVDFVRFYPGSTTTYYTGSPAGGLWKTTNSGAAWTTNTDLLSVIGTTDLAIDPLHPSIMFLATGDGDAGDTYSIGVLKSIDGGATWNPTGLTWTVSQARTISRLLINPIHPDTVYAATSAGIYRTLDGGIVWTSVSSVTGFNDMEFKPGDPTIIYASTNKLYKSTNSGQSFVNISSGLPASGVSRMAIATTEADATYVYILASKSSDEGFYGVYRSTDSGTTFSTRSTTPNILGWQTNGADAGGQGWYDLSIAASPANKDVIFTGGVNIWKSTNGGTTMINTSSWTSSGSAYVHSDIHYLEFFPGSGTTVFAGTDGGLFKTTNTGTAWSDNTANQCIAQIYGMGQSAINSGVLLGGLQDNGTIRKSATNWTRPLGGDGMKCFIDRTSATDLYMYGELYYGDLYRSSNSGNTMNTGITTGISGTGAWVTPFIQGYDANGQTLYSGFANVFKSANRGTNWAAISAWTGTTTIRAITACPSSLTTLYVIRGSVLYKTTNIGAAWTNITGTLPVSSATMTMVGVSETDANKVWVTFSGYSSANKVFYSANGGTTWTNISSGLPNLPVNCIAYSTPNGNDGIYVGTDVGVYYKDNTLAFWQPFSNGLPNTIVNELMVFTGAPVRIRAATYGRGFWESDLFNPGAGTPPVAVFTGTNLSGCPTLSVTFTDQSTNNPTAISWSFPGGNPSTSTASTQVVSYATSGFYNVTEIVANAFGTDTLTFLNYINVFPKPLPVITKTNVLCNGQSNGTASVTITGGTQPYSILWSNGPQNVTSVNGLAIGPYTVTVTDSNNCIGTVTFNIGQPAILIATSASSPDIAGAGGMAWVSMVGGTGPYTYLWNDANAQTNDTASSLPAGTYIVTVTDANGCIINDTVMVDFISSVDNSSFGRTLSIFPNPVHGQLSIYSTVPLQATIVIYDVLGRDLMHLKMENEIEKFIDMKSLPSGDYMIEIISAEKSLLKKVVKI